MKKTKRIFSIIGIVLIASMYLITLISAFFASEKALGLFLASVFSTVAIPIMLYCFIATYRWVHRNDPDNSKDTDKPDDV